MRPRLEPERSLAAAGRGEAELAGLGSEDQICQLAAIEYVNGEETSRIHLLFNPTCAMSQQAEDAHGLSINFLRENGMELADALDEFFDFLGSEVLLVAHNIYFDLRMLAQTCRAAGMIFEVEDIEMCDSLQLAKFIHPEIGCYRLDRLIDVLGVEGVNNHDAMDDALACAGLFHRLVNEGTCRDV